MSRPSGEPWSSARVTVVGTSCEATMDWSGELQTGEGSTVVGISTGLVPAPLLTGEQTYAGPDSREVTWDQDTLVAAGRACFSPLGSRGTFQP